MDFSRLRQGELIAGIAGIALIVFLFFDWYEGVSGYSAFGGDLTGLIIFLAGVTAVKFAGLAAMGKRLNIAVPRGGITLLLGVLATLIIIWSLFVTEFDGVAFGLFLGLAATIAIALGALLALREDGWEPLVGDGRPGPARSAASSTASTSKTPAAKKSAAKKSAATTRPSRKKSAAKKSAARR